MNGGNGVSTKTLGKKRFPLSKWLVRLWSGRPVLTFEKCLKWNRLAGKTTTPCSAQFLVHFFALTDYDVKLPFFSFFRECEQTMKNLSFSYQTWIFFFCLKVFNSSRDHIHQTKQTSWDNSAEVLKSAKSRFELVRKCPFYWACGCCWLLTSYFFSFSNQNMLPLILSLKDPSNTYSCCN